MTAVEKTNDEVRFGGIRKFVNNTDHLVILMDKKKRPIFLPSQEKKKDHYFTMNGLDFHPRVVVFRYDGLEGKRGEGQSSVLFYQENRGGETGRESLERTKIQDTQGNEKDSAS